MISIRVLGIYGKFKISNYGQALRATFSRSKDKNRFLPKNDSKHLKNTLSMPKYNIFSINNVTFILLFKRQICQILETDFSHNTTCPATEECVFINFERRTFKINMHFHNHFFHNMKLNLYLLQLPS